MCMYVFGNLYLTTVCLMGHFHASFVQQGPSSEDFSHSGTQEGQKGQATDNLNFRYIFTQLNRKEATLSQS